MNRKKTSLIREVDVTEQEVDVIEHGSRRHWLSEQEVDVSEQEVDVTEQEEDVAEQGNRRQEQGGIRLWTWK